MNNGEQFFNTAAGGYAIQRSLRFNAADSSFLSRTPASAGNRKTYTFSAWIKIAKLSDQFLFSSVSGSRWGLYINSSGNLITDLENTGPYNSSVGVYRDPSAWYHIVWTVDTTNSTAINRSIIYANGVRIADNNPRTLTQNSDTAINSTNAHYISRSSDLTWYLNAYLADIHFLDGITPGTTTRTVNGVTETILTDFGEFSATTGVWVPKAYTGSYGTNGFHLDFADNSAATAAALGKDTSGNGNNFTPSNLSVTAGAGNDSLIDVPVNGSEVDTGLGGQVRGNYCTWNPLISTSGPISNGNLEMVGASAWRNTKGTISVSTGKWYFEATYTGSQYGSAIGNLAAGIGFAKSNVLTPNVDVNDSSLYGSILAFSQTGHVNNFNAPSSARSQIASGDVIGFALNYDAGTYTIYVNNTSTSSGSLNFTGELTPWTNAYYSGSYFILNFGQRPFAYPVAGHKSLNTASLPSPLVTKPSDLFQAITYTGNGSSQTISGLGFSPDFVWLKNRSAGDYHRLNDIIRGANRHLFSNTTDGEVVNDANGYLSAFTSDGFSLTSGTGVNASGNAYAAWCWDAGNTTVTNTQGSITSTVRANASAGFSVVTFNTGSSGVKTVGHGLNVAPQFFVIKSRSSTGQWAAYHAAIGYDKYMLLHSTSAAISDSGQWVTSPTSSVFTFNSGYSTGTNVDYVGYFWTPVVGYSSFGSYTGNGSSTDNTFVYTGMRPRFVLLKRSDSTGNWVIWDAVRNAYNVANSILLPNTSAAEYSPDAKIDILSNGFKIRDNSSDSGTNGATYIYAAFAESPFAANNRAR